MVQRGHVYAIVDEVDSILIDEARTPLIISGPSSESAQLYYQFAGVARTLDPRRATTRSTRRSGPSPRPRRASRRSSGQLGVDNLYDLVSVNYVHQLTQALQAKELYKRDKDYLVADGEVKIVDEFTGPHPRGPALVRRPAPGGRGQGAGPDQGGEPHLGDGHPPELLPPLREARRA